MITVRCVVENTATRSSTFWAEHGIAFHIDTPDGQVLFDTGQSGQVFLHNAEQFGIDLGQVDALAASHAHYDHTGGYELVLPHLRPMIPLYAHADLFRERYTQRGEEYVSIGLRMSREELAQQVELYLSTDPVEIIPGVWTTGDIVERPEFEGRSPQHRIRVDEQWQPDPYRDDLSLVLEAGDGLVLLCGCCHAGLLNTLKHVKRIFKKDIHTVIGGTHLASASPEMLQRAVNEIPSTYGVKRLYPNHCTGERAFITLANAFGENVQPFPTGSTLTFE
jgi:7,8-dihydropterin-6-yl-methyl-4-(beta-D-ribofuranosyl)aminobenzene 5'-phosphate synthase